MSRIVLMGSGETAPAMVKTHRAVLPSPATGPAVMLDTPYGFQVNADDLTSRTRRYFDESVGHEGRPGASWRRARPALRPERRARPRPGQPRSLALRRSRQPDLRARASGTARRWPVRSATSSTVEARSSSAAPLPSPLGAGPCRSTRSTRSGAAPVLGRGTRPAHTLPRPAGCRDPALRQRRGRNLRHPLLLPRRGAATRSCERELPAGRRGARGRRAHRGDRRPRREAPSRCRGVGRLTRAAPRAQRGHSRRHHGDDRRARARSWRGSRATCRRRFRPRTRPTASLTPLTPTHRRRSTPTRQISERSSTLAMA